MLGIKVDEEIYLKILEKHHAPQMFELVDSCREYLRPWMPWVDSTLSVKDVEDFVCSTQKRFAENLGFVCSIWFKGEMAGCGGFHPIDQVNKKGSLGYWVAEKFQGNGIITRSCSALLDYAFNEYKLNRMEIACTTKNIKSRAIPERLGFKHEGTLRQVELVGDRMLDHEIYGLLASEWNESKR